MPRITLEMAGFGDMTLVWVNLRVMEEQKPSILTTETTLTTY